jgi:hypothetical protein
VITIKGLCHFGASLVVLSWLGSAQLALGSGPARLNWDELSRVELL